MKKIIVLFTVFMFFYSCESEIIQDLSIEENKERTLRQSEIPILPNTQETTSILNTESNTVNNPPSRAPKVLNSSNEEEECGSPSFEGLTELCPGQSATLCLKTDTGPYAITWSSSSNLSITGTGPCVTVSATTSTLGTGTVHASYSSGRPPLSKPCGGNWSTGIAIVAPYAPVFTISTVSSVCPNSQIVVGVSSNENLDLSWSAGLSASIISSSNDQANVQIFGGTKAVVTVTATNGCGESSTSSILIDILDPDHYYCIESGGGGNNGDPGLPNDCPGQLKVNQNNNKVSQIGITGVCKDGIHILDIEPFGLRTSRPFSFTKKSVNSRIELDLPKEVIPGKYMLSVTNKENRFTQRTSIEIE